MYSTKTDVNPLRLTSCVNYPRKKLEYIETKSFYILDSSSIYARG